MSMIKIYVIQNKDQSLSIVSPNTRNAIEFMLDPFFYSILRNDLFFYRIVAGELKFDQKLKSIYPFRTKEDKIIDLKDQLSKSDYKVVKCIEAQMVGDLMPYDSKKLHDEREKIRRLIRELEEQ